MVCGLVWGVGLRRLGCGCGRRLVTGSCVIRETTQTGRPRSRPAKWEFQNHPKLRQRDAFSAARGQLTALRASTPIDGHLPWRRRATPSLLRSRAVFGRIQDASHQTWWDARDDA